MKNLLNLTIDAYGGLSRWENLPTITARLRTGGVLWPLKGHAGVMDDTYVTVDLKKQWVSHRPFIQPDWRTSFDAKRVAIETTGGKVVEELFKPRASFAGHVTETPWTKLQLTYFIGYAMWTYFNAPFAFALPGYEAEEIEPWTEHGEQLRRLKITFPDHVATHSKTQVFYIGSDGLIKRHDYDVDVAGGASAAHYIYDHTRVDGIYIPTKRLVYVRNSDNTPLPEPLLVSIDISEIKIS